ncbi:MAG: Mov34/MPN/PAD-1 family protein [Phycisphaerae bacterium]
MSIQPTTSQSHRDLPGEGQSPAELRLTRSMWQWMIEHARQCAPLECCGVLMGHVENGASFVTSVMPSRNISPHDRTRSFQLDWTTMREACAISDKEILGFYHSHPASAPFPSEDDYNGTWYGFACLILGHPFDSPQSLRAWEVPAPHHAFVSRPVIIYDA